MGSQPSKPPKQEQQAPQVTDPVQQRAPQVTDPVHLEVKKKIQQLRAIAHEEPQKRAQKLRQINSQLIQNKSPQYEAILHDLFDLFYELYAESSNEFDSDEGLAFYLTEIIHGLGVTHPEFATVFEQSLTTFPGQKKIIQQKLVRPILKEWAEAKRAEQGAEQGGEQV